MLETMSAAHLGALLKAKVHAGWSGSSLADWAHEVYLTTVTDDAAVTNCLMTLIAMREGPQFRLGDAELLSLADSLQGKT